jgi:hypothetical protein
LPLSFSPLLSSPQSCQITSFFLLSIACDGQYILKLLTVNSGHLSQETRIHWHRRPQLASQFFQNVWEWLPDRSNSEHNFLRWSLKGFLLTTLLTCMWEIISPGMTTRSEFKDAVLFFTSGMRYHLKLSDTKNSLLFRRAPGLLFLMTRIQSVNTSFVICQFSWIQAVVSPWASFFIFSLSYT